MSNVPEENTKSLAAMTAEIRENNIEKGWRSAEGGPGSNTFGDYVALLHSEISEALEAYRDNRLADATDPHNPYPDPPGDVRFPKPEGVGSEFADVLIRLIDMCDVFEVDLYDMDMELADVAPLPAERIAEFGLIPISFGDWIEWLHASVVTYFGSRPFVDPPSMLRALITAAEHFGIDLTAEYERKIAFNRTRTYQHGGRTVSDGGAS